MLTDPISDMLTRIRNALMAGKTEVVFPYSAIKEAIVLILKREGFIADFSIQEREMSVVLKYDGHKPSITSIRRISKPGCRVYSSAKDIKYVPGGIAILSTPLGIITGKEAKKQKVGGEVICEVY